MIWILTVVFVAIVVVAMLIGKFLWSELWLIQYLHLDWVTFLTTDDDEELSRLMQNHLETQERLWHSRVFAFLRREHLEEGTSSLLQDSTCRVIAVQTHTVLYIKLPWHWRSGILGVRSTHAHIHVFGQGDVMREIVLSRGLPPALEQDHRDFLRACALMDQVQTHHGIAR